ncbi:MAG: hypothetical protein AAF221_11210 [Pseudomonadota bacterium]
MSAFITVIVAVSTLFSGVTLGQLGGTDIRLIWLCALLLAVPIISAKHFLIPKLLLLAAFYIASVSIMSAVFFSFNIIGILTVFLAFFQTVIIFNLLQAGFLTSFIQGFTIAAKLLIFSIFVETALFYLVPDVLSRLVDVIPFYYSPTGAGQFRASGFAYEPSEAAFLLSGLLIVFARARRYGWLAACVLAMVLSRSSLAIGAAFVVLTLSAARRGPLYLLGGAGIASILAFFTAKAPAISDRMTWISAVLNGWSIFNKTNLVLLTQIGSTVGAIAISFEAVLHAFKLSFGFGVGPGNFQFALRDLFSSVYGLNIAATENLRYVTSLFDRNGENLFLRLGAEFGLAGITACVFLYIASIRVFFASLTQRVHHDPDYADLLFKASALALCFLSILFMRKESYATIYLPFAAGFLTCYARPVINAIKGQETLSK